MLSFKKKYKGGFKKAAVVAAFLLVIVCINEVLALAMKPCTYFRNDIHNLETKKYTDIFVGTSHGKAGIKPHVVDEITGGKSINLCLGGEEVIDSLYIVKEACRVNNPKRIIYELDPGYWVVVPSLGPEYRTVYDELPMSGVKAEYYMDKIWSVDFRTTLFPWYLYRKGIKGAVSRLRSKFSEEYRNYEDSFYDTCEQSYGGEGHVSIPRIDGTKTEKNLELWDEKELKEEASESFDKIAEFCKEKGIELVVIVTPIPQETFGKYRENFEAADKFFRDYMADRGIEYYNFNYIDVDGFDRSLNGFSDYEGHMYDDQAEVLSRKIGEMLKNADK